MSGRNDKDPLTKGLSMLVAFGALAFGAAAAFMNSERSKQMREDLQRQINDLSNKLETSLAERRPEIEDAIQRSRKVAVEGLEKMKGVVDQSADKAQEYVYRASSKAANATADTTARVQEIMLEAGEPIEAGTTDAEASTPQVEASGETDSARNNPS